MSPKEVRLTIAVIDGQIEELEKARWRIMDACKHPNAVRTWMARVPGSECPDCGRLGVPLKS